MQLTKTGEYIGTASIKLIGSGTYEFGNNIIDSPYQGKGYFREVFQQILELVGSSNLIATVRLENETMQNIYRRFRMFESQRGLLKVFSRYSL